MKFKSNFTNIANRFRPIPFWSWNDKLDIHETVEQVDKMNAQGLGGFFMHARGGLKTEYMGKEWFRNVEVCIDKCKENGMLVWAYDENGWPSGFGNGIVNGKGVEYQQKYLRYEKKTTHTDTSITTAGGYHFYYDVNPFYVDTLDGKVTDEFINNVYKDYYDRFGDEFEGFFTDEPQISRNGIPWSFVLPDEYFKAYGQELLPRLHHLFFEADGYEQTRVNFWKLVSDLFSQNFTKKIYDWCTSHNLKITGHLVFEDTLYGQVFSNGACMPHYEYFTIPGMDWLGRTNEHTLAVYQVASAAKQTGKEQVLAEIFALCGHNVGHDELKSMYEYRMVRGINLLCQHLEGYSNRGIRKRDYPPAMYIQQPWWNHYKQFNDTVSRIGMLLTDGDDGVDVLVIHPQTTVWTLYNDGEYYNSADTKAKDAISKLNSEFMEILISLEKKHINFHLGDETLMERHGSVCQGELVIGAKRYKKVIIPSCCKVLLSNTERLIREFEAGGGTIISANELCPNNIIDIPEITYCERHCSEYSLYYFVNSTDTPFTATISKGNKRMEPVTGKIYDFNGVHHFQKYDSLIVIDDHTGRTGKKTVQKDLVPIELGGEWKIDKCTDNILTLDYCDYYFDGELQEKSGYVLNVMNRALDKGEGAVKSIVCNFNFEAECIPTNLYLVCETPDIFAISVNGTPIDKADCGYFLDKAFRKINIAKYAKTGTNVISLSVNFHQSTSVYENIEKAKKFESEKNKLTFDMEIEQIYLVGDFAVATKGDFEELDRNACRFDGEFVLTSPKESICLTNIERNGFPFFAGEIIVSRTFWTDTLDMMLDFEKCGFNVIKAKINSVELAPFMWEPYTADITPYVRCGNNKIELTLVNNLRNMQGPFHLSEGESHWVGPSSFYKEACVWYSKYDSKRWDDRYCFANLSLKNRE